LRRTPGDPGSWEFLLGRAEELSASSLQAARELADAKKIMVAIVERARVVGCSLRFVIVTSAGAGMVQVQRTYR
jgi:hypothetical protein